MGGEDQWGQQEEKFAGAAVTVIEQRWLEICRSDLGGPGWSTQLAAAWLHHCQALKAARPQEQDLYSGHYY